MLIAEIQIRVHFHSVAFFNRRIPNSVAQLTDERPLKLCTELKKLRKTGA